MTSGLGGCRSVPFSLVSEEQLASTSVKERSGPDP
jgi:hypothetical protein